MVSKKKNHPDALSFEEALAELTEIVRDLEDGALSLDESLAKYEQGIRHLGRCQKMLSEAERKIEVLHGFDADGEAITNRFDEADMSLDEKAQQRSRRRSAQATGSDSSSADETPPHADSGDVDVSGTLF